jgi:hypothetical protein
MMTMAARGVTATDADVTALLSLAMNATSRERKTAALVLANAVRTTPALHDILGKIAVEAGHRYGDGTAAQVHVIASELHLN